MMRSYGAAIEPFIMLFLLLYFLLSIQKFSNALDTISTTHFLSDGQTIVSSNGTFELGFFSPGSSKNRYVGIWHKKISPRRVVWVANREIPITNKSGVLKIINSGTLALLINDTNNNSIHIWSSDTTQSGNTRIAQLLDSGNLVVKDENDDDPENFLWQSFDYPRDTLLPGMKLGKNLVTGLDRYLSSWKSNDDPAPGDYTFHCDPTGFPQNVMKRGSVEVFRSAPFHGVNNITRAENLRQQIIYTWKIVSNKEEVYFSYEPFYSSVVSIFSVNQTGLAQHLTWVEQTKQWNHYLTLPGDECDNYARCGPNGLCNVGNGPGCWCLNNFVPESLKDWEITNWSKGCRRKTPLDCNNGDGFLKYSEIKLPDLRYALFKDNMSLKECGTVCLKNCSCMAYANLDIQEGSGCLLWFGDLVDIRVYPRSEQDVYIRLASTELASQFGSKGRKQKILVVISSLLVVLLLLCISLILYVRNKKNLQVKREGKLGHNSKQANNNENEEDLELPLFDLSTITNATENFSVNNKLGEGGFGPVYKGVLEEGQEIAVKRLSKSSKQGLDEFQNEVICIAKLQHRNLVKLLGCCIQGEEKMLVYEYMPNKSLDLFLFDHKQSTLLDWPKRFHIINGIARGLLYLHEDSRLRIIHRDLKASNILLDMDLNPNISDFGLARICGEYETEANTSRVVGTYGYMSPEYAIDGHFSVKSDVFSFGVLVLEIVSGKRNRGFVHREHQHNLLGHAWRLYKEGRSLELVDAPAGDYSCYLNEVLRSIQVGLLCVQQCLEDRPSMSSVVLMLGRESTLPPPKQPGFFAERSVFETECSSSTNAFCSTNEITITLLDAR